MESFIDEAVEQFAHDHTKPESELYVRLREETYRDMNCPQMQVGRIEGRFLKMLVRLTGARSNSGDRNVHRLQRADDGRRPSR